MYEINRKVVSTNENSENTAWHRSCSTTESFTTFPVPKRHTHAHTHKKNKGTGI